MKNKIDQLKNRLKENEKETAEKRSAAADIMAKYTDATGPERGKISQEWAALQAELSLLDAEREELQARHDAAYLAPLELAVKEAEDEVDQLGQAATDARLAMQELSKERLHFLNRGGRGGESDKTDRTIIKMEAIFAEAKAKSRLSAKKATRAVGRLDHAREDLRSAQGELA